MAGMTDAEGGDPLNGARIPLLGWPAMPVTGQVWMVIFLDPPAPGSGAPWPNRLLWRALQVLRPGFRHVLAVAPVGTGQDWLVIDPSATFLATGLLRGRALPQAIRSAVERQSVHVVVVRSRAPARYRPRGPFTCSAAIAHLLGVPTGLFVTPYGLYRRLQRLAAIDEAGPAGI